MKNDTTRAPILAVNNNFLSKLFSNVCRYLFRSGNTEHPSDRFYNTTVEILPELLAESSPLWSSYNSTPDGFLIIGNFNSFGIAEGSVDTKFGKIKEIRLHVHSDSENWAILSEVNNIAQYLKLFFFL